MSLIDPTITAPAMVFVATGVNPGSPDLYKCPCEWCDKFREAVVWKYVSAD